MSWMIGKNKCTFPQGRLDLGYKPNLRINVEKTNYNYGIYDQYLNNYRYCDNGPSSLDLVTGIGATVVNAANAGLEIAAAIKGAKAEKKDETGNANEQPETTNLSEDQQAQINELKQQQEKSKALLQKAITENQELKELSKLHQEGIEKNDDGTYTTTIKDVFGNAQKITANTVEEVRETKKAEETKINEQKEYCKENDITVTSDGTFSKTVKLPDGTEETFVGKTPEEAQTTANDALKMFEETNKNTDDTTDIKDENYMA